MDQGLTYQAGWPGMWANLQCIPPQSPTLTRQASRISPETECSHVTVHCLRAPVQYIGAMNIYLTSHFIPLHHWVTITTSSHVFPGRDLLY